MNGDSRVVFERGVRACGMTRIRRVAVRSAPGRVLCRAGHRTDLWRLGCRVVLASVLVTCTATVLHAREQLCDPQFSDCRTPLLNLIRNENRRIDVAFWYMADARYSTAIVERFQAGVHVRVLVDERANGNKPFNGVILQRLKDAGIPMRAKRGGGILHWKVMIFDGQDIVQFSKANYSAESFVPIERNVNWTDEAIFLTGDDQITNTFRTKFDDLWRPCEAAPGASGVTRRRRTASG